MTPDCERIVQAFRFYLDGQGLTISQKEFMRNMEVKISRTGFRSDLDPLLRRNVHYDIDEAYAFIAEHLISLLD